MQRGAEVDAAMQARLDYVNALREVETLRVTSELLRQIDERLRVTREAFEAGRLPRYYVLREEAERANVVQQQAAAQSRADFALVALKTTLGLDLASHVTLADRLDYVPVSYRSTTRSVRRPNASPRSGPPRISVRPPRRTCARRTATSSPRCR